ncbi:expressed unknown protein [Seminavis robusta]|uniref:ABM domain-containing protein n=1 Tax=Seminavis robusta TaxID=568900 RepID=A0A9N8HXX0_9STRA|nr:expressed unknown protein [Seminavis robusta]|eukprot:Sro3410_g347750.1 n/a (259) ;mRNA; r:3472-4248
MAPLDFVWVDPLWKIEDPKGPSVLKQMSAKVARSKVDAWFVGHVRSTKTGLFKVNQVYKDAQAVVSHNTDVEDEVGDFQKLQGVELIIHHIHAPKEELEKLKTGYTILTGPNVHFCELLPGGICNITRLEPNDDEVGLPHNHVTIRPKQEIKDWSKWDAFVQDTVSRTATETGNLFYGYSRKEGTDEIFVLEAYEDGDAVIRHMESIGPVLQQYKDMFNLLSIDLFGPPAELEKVKPIFDPLGADYYEILDGFSRFEK